VGNTLKVYDFACNGDIHSTCDSGTASVGFCFLGALKVVTKARPP